MSNTEVRTWGNFKNIDFCEFDNSSVLTKHLTITAGNNTSYQRHQYRDEICVVIYGKAFSVLDGIVKAVNVGDIIYVRKNQKHSMRAITDFHIIEVQIGDIVSEDDVERFDWDWGTV